MSMSEPVHVKLLISLNLLERQQPELCESCKTNHWQSRGNHALTCRELHGIGTIFSVDRHQKLGRNQTQTGFPEDVVLVEKKSLELEVLYCNLVSSGRSRRKHVAHG